MLQKKNQNKFTHTQLKTKHINRHKLTELYKA